MIIRRINLAAVVLFVAYWMSIIPAFAGPSDHSDGDQEHRHEEEHEVEDDHGDHNEHGNESEEHEHGSSGSNGHKEEASTTIKPESATRMGIVVEKTGPAAIGQTVPLIGRITLNKNTSAKIRARFPGLIKSVHANLGEHVEKGQVLAVIESNESLKNYNVIAPISGVLLSRNTNVGNVSGDDHLFMIADLSDVWAKFHVFPRDAELVKVGLPIEIHTLDDGKTAIGKIDMLFPTADELSQTQIAIVLLENKARIWKPGMTIEGDVLIHKEEAKVAVKENALQKMESQGDVVFIQEGNKYIAKPVKIGRKGDGYVEIVDLLNEGELYVSEGSFIIKSDILKANAAHSH